MVGSLFSFRNACRSSIRRTQDSLGLLLKREKKKRENLMSKPWHILPFHHLHETPTHTHVSLFQLRENSSSSTLIENGRFVLRVEESTRSRRAMDVFLVLACGVGSTVAPLVATRLNHVIQLNAHGKLSTLYWSGITPTPKQTRVISYIYICSVQGSRPELQSAAGLRRRHSAGQVWFGQ